MSGLAHSRWKPPSNQGKSTLLESVRSIDQQTEVAITQSPRQIHDVAPGHTPHMKSNIPPHLQNSPADQSTSEQHVQTPEEKPAFIPPHLRGFNIPSGTPKLRHFTPTYLQATPVPVNISQESGAPAKNSPFMDNGTQSRTQPVSNTEFQTAATPPTNLQREFTKSSDQCLSGTKLAAKDFLSFLDKKMTATTEAKRKDIAEKAHLAAKQPQNVQPLIAENPWVTLNETRPSALTPRSKFRPNTETDQTFKSFLHDQIKGPITNGKKYTFTGDHQSPQTLPVTSKAVAKASPQLMSNDVDIGSLVGPGFEPQGSNEGLYNKVGNSGLGEDAKENVRASQGEDPKDEFLDWDGKTWRPPPCDWENGRSPFDNSFMGKYIGHDWVQSVPSGSNVEVNTKDPKFELAVSVGENGFESSIEHPMTIPDLENSDNQEKQQLQTAAIALKNHIRKAEKQAKARDVRARATEMHHHQFITQAQAQSAEEHPHKPRIDVYLRPAAETDCKGIADIYNYYSLNSLVTEDQDAITEEDVKYLFDSAKKEKFPFIVAIKGKMPLPSSGRFSQPKKVSFAQLESVVGFGWAEAWGWGLGNTRNGRSRFTACLQFYVHHEYTMQKVGQSLLDRLIQSLSHGYAAKDGYEWMNPADDPVYKQGGVQKFHQLLIQYAVEQKNPLNYQWMKDFLRRYFFDEEGRLQQIARSSHAGAEAKFADIIFFQKEVASANEFGAFI